MYIIYMRKPKRLPFWERVKKLLRAHRISQKDFAVFIGTKYSTLRFWFCYGYYPDVKTAFDISVALGVSTEYLMTGIDGKQIKKREKEVFARKTAAADIKKMVKKIETKADMIG